VPPGWSASGAAHQPGCNRAALRAKRESGCIPGLEWRKLTTPTGGRQADDTSIGLNAVPGLAQAAVGCGERCWSFASTGTPALLGSLPGNTEPGSDLCPAVARSPQSVHAMLHRSAEFVGHGGQSGESLDVASGDAATAAAHDTSQESEVLIVLGDALRPFRCQCWVDTGLWLRWTRHHNSTSGRGNAGSAARTGRDPEDGSPLAQA
jgi:hypothetical protein